MMAGLATLPAGERMQSRPLSTLDRQLARNLRVLRTARGAKLEWLASVTGMSVSSIDQYENEKRRIPASKLFLLSQAMELPIELFYRNVDGIALTQEQKEDKINKLIGD